MSTTPKPVRLDDGYLAAKGGTYSITQAAAQLSIGITSAYDRVKSGDLDSITVGTTRRIPARVILRELGYTVEEQATLARLWRTEHPEPEPVEYADPLDVLAVTI